MTNILYDTPGPGPAGYKPKIMETPPRYSLTPKREIKSALLQNPGPGAYDIKPQNSEVKKSISSKPPPRKMKDVTPGPGFYNPKSPQKIEKPSIGSKFPIKEPDGPAPNQYKAEKHNAINGQKGFTMPKNSPIPRHEQSPGPAAYGKFDKPPQGISIRPKTADFDRKVENCAPGPIYDVKPQRSRSGFSLSSRCDIDRTPKSPGPAAYITTSRPQSGFSIKGKPEDLHMKEQRQIPGPGEYDIKDQKTIGKTIGQKQFRKFLDVKEVTPGPGSYEVKQRPASAISLKSKVSTGFKNENPGPGQYTVHQKEVGQGRHSSMGQKNQRFYDDPGTPGPAAYRCQSAPISRNGPKCSFGHKGGAIFQIKDDTPGPGSYSVRSSRQAKGSTMGTRFQIRHK